MDGSVAPVIDPAARCPHCAVAEQAEEDAIRLWLLGGDDGEGAGGVPDFCPRHALALARCAHLDARGRIAALVDRAEAELWDAAARPHRSLRAWLHARRGATVADGESCPACGAGRRAAAAAARDLAVALGQAASRAAYASGPGLCQQHLWGVLAQAPPATGDWLAADGAARLRRLVVELDRYFELLDYRLAHLPRGGEQTAWRRALAYFWPPAPEAAAVPGDRPPPPSGSPSPPLEAGRG